MIHMKYQALFGFLRKDAFGKKNYEGTSWADTGFWGGHWGSLLILPHFSKTSHENEMIWYRSLRGGLSDP